ncbi:Polypeptide N-acetylgalactosaminyltransferase 16 [Sparganum proliferum]
MLSPRFLFGHICKAPSAKQILPCELDITEEHFRRIDGPFHNSRFMLFPRPADSRPYLVSLSTKLLMCMASHQPTLSPGNVEKALVKIILTIFIANFEIDGDFLEPTEHRTSTSSQCLNWSGRLQGYLDNLTLSNCSHWRPDLFKCSIIIVTHNEPLTTLISTIESIKSNTSKSLLQELIIVDDSSEEPISLDDLKSTTSVRC